MADSRRPTTSEQPDTLTREAITSIAERTAMTSVGAQRPVEGMDRKEWVYEPAADGTARFVLGEVGQNPLVCFGINPSTAVPYAPDPTIKRVRRFASDNGFDGWTMLNVYPQIATDPKDIDREYRDHLREENERHIARLLSDRPLTLLAAWGGLVTSRPYFPALLRGIIRLTTDAGCDWVSLGEPTKYGHPRHPLYVRGETPLQPFDVAEYLHASF